MKNTPTRILTLLIVVVFWLPVQAQLVLESFPFEFGGRSKGLVIDALDNVILAGSYGESAGPPYARSIIRKYNPSGTMLWKADLISSGGASGIGTCTDAAGNIYVVGEFYNSDFQLAGGPSVPNSGSTDLFLTKYSPDGTQLWIRSYGGTGLEDPIAITGDAAGNVYIIGESVFNGSPINFGNNITLPSTVTTGFIFKVSPSGTTLWAKTVSNGADAVAMDQSGNSVLLTGDFLNNSNYVFTIGSVTFPTLTGGLFIAKLDTAGVPVWVKTNTLQQPGPQYGYAHALTTDASGAVYVAGSYNGNLTIDGVTLSTGTTFDNRYGFVMKFDAAGALLWHKMIYFPAGTTTGFIPRELLVDNTGNIFLAGNLDDGPITIDGHTFTLTGGDEILLFKFDPLGNYIWGIQGSGPANQLTYGLGIDSENNCYLTGDIVGISGTYTLGNYSSFERDCFVYKIRSGNHFNRVSGLVFYDANFNGLKDSTEMPASGVVVQSQPNAYYTATMQNGLYNIFVDSGASTVTLPSAPLYHTLVPASHAISFSGAGYADTTRHFALQPVAGMQDLQVNVVSPAAARPGFAYPLHMLCRNVGTIPMSGSVEITLDSLLIYQSTLPANATVTGNTITWSFTNLGPAQTSVLVVNTTIPGTTTLGVGLNQSASIFPVTGDLNLSDNNYLFSDTTQGSFDPNDKKVNLSSLTTTQVQNQEWLEYTIRFQNTGTDTAFTVRLADTLSTMLNIPTVEVLASSHPHTWSIKGTGIMEFRFDNILLPDSNTNEAASHGFVKYRIKPQEDLQPGDVIENTAYIYFDFNAPVVTNTATTEVSFVNSVALLERNPLHIYPNPNNGTFTLQCSNIYAPQVLAELRNVLGQIVWQQNLQTENGKLQQLINTSNLSKGVYYMQVKTDRGSKVQKVVLE